MILAFGPGLFLGGVLLSFFNSLRMRVGEGQEEREMGGVGGGNREKGGERIPSRLQLLEVASELEAPNSEPDMGFNPSTIRS